MCAAVCSVRRIVDVDKGGWVMDIHAKIRAGEYETKLPFKVERVPVDEERMTVKQAREHVEAEKLRDREQRRLHDEDNTRRLAQFQADLAEVCGLVGHPKEGAVYEMAWNDAHSDGLANVLYRYQELADLVL